MSNILSNAIRYVRDEDRALAIAAGFSAYCVKPLDTAAFIRTVDRILLTGGGERSGVLWCQ